MQKKFRYKVKKIYYVIPIIVVLISNCHFSYSHASELSFSVNPITPSIQRQGSKNKYFDVLMAPGEDTDLKVNLKNTTDKDLTIDIDVVPATTNGFGNIEYSDKGLRNSVNLPMDIKKNIEFPEQIVLKSNSTQEVNFRLHMIDKKFDGKIVSGIHFEEHDQKEKIRDDSTESVAINNLFAYNLALVAAQNKNVVSSELELKGSHFITESGVSNAVIDVENVGAEFANDISTELKIENISSNSIELQGLCFIQ
ncbi:hypothetical protein A5884_003484 [Enterococcus sp. 7D2_DIV0200]|uniref:DUF916 domain-containing protein n=1 Tax=Enterococcus sp. 7D2_DIV0200 TaxID=1834187 RepID=UPI000A33E223|nr:DUF916 domain-containing protein [Enterococcus sp. 7D2_DIV0200]OTP47513.1 hypothetical protein A5884_003484 [Enterococcus sp. 7D2_DIV0200]